MSLLHRWLTNPPIDIVTLLSNMLQDSKTQL